MAKIKIKQCWEITIVDDNGEPIRYENQYGDFERFMSVVYGSKEEAENEGKDLLDYYEKNKEVFEQ